MKLQLVVERGICRFVILPGKLRSANFTPWQSILQHQASSQLTLLYEVQTRPTNIITAFITSIWKVADIHVYLYSLDLSHGNATMRIYEYIQLPLIFLPIGTRAINAVVYRMEFW